MTGEEESNDQEGMWGSSSSASYVCSGTFSVISESEVKLEDLKPKDLIGSTVKLAFLREAEVSGSASNAGRRNADTDKALEDVTKDVVVGKDISMKIYTPGTSGTPWWRTATLRGSS